MSYTICRESHDAVVDRYRDLSMLARVSPSRRQESIFVGFVTHDGNAYRFIDTPTVSQERFDAFFAGLENAYRPLIVYAVHR